MSRKNELFPSFLLEEFASACVWAGADQRAGDEELALRWGRPDPARFDPQSPWPPAPDAPAKATCRKRLAPPSPR